MPRYIIERNFAEQLDLTKEGVEKVNLINDQEGVQWIFSFSAPTRKRPIASTTRLILKLSGRPHEETTSPPMRDH